jgi:hypothetical protein
MGIKMIQVDGSDDSTPSSSSVSLPTTGNVPPEKIEDYSLYIFGQHKIGKTSFTTMFKKALHLFYEPGGKDYAGIMHREPNNWKEFLSYVDLLEKDSAQATPQFSTVILDPVDLCYRDCLLHVCKTMHGSDYPPTNDFGKTWNKIGEEFRKAIYRLAKVKGVIFVSHAKEVTITKSDDSTYDLIRPTAANKAHEILSKFCDLTGYMYMDKYGSRVMRILPDQHIEAGNRFSNHFRYKNSDVPISEIDLGTSKEHAYNNFVDAFSNLKPLASSEADQSSGKTDSSSPKPKISIKRV